MSIREIVYYEHETFVAAFISIKLNSNAVMFSSFKLVVS